MFEWQIDAEEYLRRLGLDKNAFLQYLFLPRLQDVRRIIPLRDIVRVDSLLPMHKDTLSYLLRKVRTANGLMPFEHAAIRFAKFDPHCFKIGQKFVYRENYQLLLEQLPELFGQFVTPNGLNELGAYFVFGSDKMNEYALACYLPPIVEKHGSDLVIMDGIHRNYIVKQIAPAMNVIVVENVSAPFPCGFRDWSEVEVIALANKPKELEKKFFELKKGLFRDLKYLGIDG